MEFSTRFRTVSSNFLYYFSISSFLHTEGFEWWYTYS